MNIQSIILMLQLAVSLLTNPQLNQNAALKAQALDFANQAVVLANQALQVPPETAVQAQVTTSTPPVVPAIPTSTPVVPQQPALGQPVFAAAPALTVQKALNNKWPTFGSIVSRGSSTEFEFACGGGKVDYVTKMDITFNGQTFDIPVTPWNSAMGQVYIDNVLAGIEAGKSYSYKFYCETDGQYGEESSIFTMPLAN